MALWVACFDWGKGSVLATSQYLIAVGPASKWDGSAMMRGHVEEMMVAAKDARNTQARGATGVELGFAAAEDWLAAKLANAALFKQVLLAQAVEEYEELMRLMSKDGCLWVQVGTSDWGEDSGLVTDSAGGEALLLAYPPEGSIMSDVEGAPAVDGSVGGGGGFIAKLHGIEGPVVVRPVVGTYAERRLFEGLKGEGQDNLSEVLGGEKGKRRLPSRWAGEVDMDDVSEDGMQVGDGEPLAAAGSRGVRVCSGLCLDRIAA